MSRPFAAVAAIAVVLSALFTEARPAGAAAVAVGTNGISMSSSSVGATWNSPITIDGAVSFPGVWFFSESGGIAVGNNNSIFRTTNGGGNWSPISSPITTTYNDVMFPTATTGYIAATNGQVLKTTNAGTSWTAQSTPSAGSLLGIHFVSATQGCAVGFSGAIVRTTDGGSNWIDETTGSAHLADVFFFDASNGWAVGTGGTILRTTTGGNSWSSVTSGTTVDLAAVWFTSATRGFVCGGDRVLRTTTNGGTSWSAITLSGTSQQSGLFDVMFADPDTGIVVGSGHNAFRTIDGGTTWTIANPDPTGEVLQAVHLSRPPGPPPQVTITVNTVPAGRSYTFDGTTFTSQQTFTFDSGSSHTLSVPTPQTISAGERYAFTQWSGGSTSTSSSITIAPTSSATFTANLQRQFLLTMPSVTGGSVSPGTGWRAAGSNVSISANDGTGYDFVAWTGSGSGSYSGTNNPASISMNGPITETADFDPSAISLTFASVPSGRTVIIDGTTRTTPYVMQTTADVSHTLNLASPQGESNGTRLAFQSWSDGGAQSHTIDPLVSGTYTVTFKTQYYLDTVALPSGGGSISPGDGWRDAGSRVTLTPVASLNYTFYFMSGTGTGSVTGFPGDFGQATMDGPITQTASFSSATMRTITVQSSPPGPSLSIGSIDIGTAKTFVWPNALPLPISAPVTEDAIFNTKRWQFTNWGHGGARSQTVTPTASGKYTAYFDVQFALVLSAEAGGTTNPAAGTTWCDSNTVVGFTALPDSNHTFQGWSGTGSTSYSGPNNPGSITIRGKVAELARFDFLPRLTMGTPPGGPRFVGGVLDTIAWTTNFVGNVKLEYRLGAAGTLQLITASTENDGFFTWTPPDAPTSQLYLRVSEVTDGNPTSQGGPFLLCDPILKTGPTVNGLILSTGPEDAAVADFNEDGIPDVLLTGAAGVAIRWGTGVSGSGTGTFSSVSAVNLLALTRAVAVVDVNEDDRQDIVAALDDGRIAIARGNGTGAVGNGTFANPIFLTAGTSLRDIEAGDFNEDGRVDLVAADSAGQRLLFLAGGGTAPGISNGTFLAAVSIPLGFAPTALRSADVDEDGIFDLLVGSFGTSANDVAILRGGGSGARGDGTFSPLGSVGTTGNVADIALGDFDDDGITDFAYSDPTGQRVRVARGRGYNTQGDGGFDLVAEIAAGSGPGALGCADFDRDGHLDLVVGLKSTGLLKLLLGTGVMATPFVALQNLSDGYEQMTALVLGDFREDGIPDVFTAGTNLSVQTARVFTGDHSTCAVNLVLSVIAPFSIPGTYNVGGELPIRWIAEGDDGDPSNGRIAAADIDLSRDGGVTWERIARGVTKEAFTWTVTPPAAASCRLRISDAASHLRTDLSSTFAITANTVDVGDVPVLPRVAALSAAWPNPAQGETRLRMDLPTPAGASLVVYDVAGRRVRQLVDGPLEAGSHRIAWDGRDDGGRRVAAGVYFVRGRWAAFAGERRVVFLP